MIKELKDLRNVGKATLSDLRLLGITTVEELAKCDKAELFHKLERETGGRHDPCVWDVFCHHSRGKNRGSDFMVGMD